MKIWVPETWLLRCCDRTDQETRNREDREKTSSFVLIIWADVLCIPQGGEFIDFLMRVNVMISFVWVPDLVSYDFLFC
jgi:hypothetical protein